MDSDSPFASGLIYEIQDYSIIVSVLYSMFYSWGWEFPLTYSRWFWYHTKRIPFQMELVGKSAFSFTFFFLACLFALRNQKALDFTKIFLKIKERKNCRTSVLFVGPLIPLFWTSGDFCPGIPSLSPVGNRVLSFTSGATPADLLVASMVSKPFSSM